MNHNQTPDLNANKSLQEATLQDEIQKATKVFQYDQNAIQRVLQLLDSSFCTEGMEKARVLI